MTKKVWPFLTKFLLCCINVSKCKESLHCLCVLIHIQRCRLQKQYCASNKLFVTVYLHSLPNF